MEIIDTQVLRDMTDSKQLLAQYNEMMPINDPEFRDLIVEDFCSVCTSPCRIRKYIVQSICCNNRVCNSCHIEHLKHTTRPYCMYCKSVWTHYNITNWFSPKDAKLILECRVLQYSKMGDSYNSIRRKVAEIIREQIVPLFPILKAVRPTFSKDIMEYNSFILMLRGYHNTDAVFSKQRKYLDIRLESVMHITDDDIGQLVDNYGLLTEGKTKSAKKKYKQLTKELQRTEVELMDAVHAMQQVLTDSRMTNCPKCSAMIPDFDTNTLRSIDCPYCGSIIDTTDFKLISTSFSAPICKINNRHLVHDAIEMFKKICTPYSISKYINSHYTHI